MQTDATYFERFAVIIITGASSGIGRSLIKAIRKLAPNATVCNLSRQKPEEFTGFSDHHFSTDLTDPLALDKSFDQVMNVLHTKPDGRVLLINNSGFGDYGKTQDLQREKQLAMIDLNVRAVVDLTMRLLPNLIERGGQIVTIASTASFQPTPYLATYGATKAFVRNWSLALNEDLKGADVTALAVCPGPTKTNFFKSAGFSSAPMGDRKDLLGMTSKAVAEQTIRAIAREQSLLVNGWQNKLITAFSGLLPLRLITKLSASILRRMRLDAHK